MDNNTQTTEFFVQTDGQYRLIRINASALLYLQSDWNYVHIHVDGTQYMVYLSLRSLLEQLQPFPVIQVHKSYAINLDKLKGVTGNRIFLSNGTEIPLGRSFRKGFFEILEDQIIKRKRI